MVTNALQEGYHYQKIKDSKLKAGLHWLLGTAFNRRGFANLHRFLYRSMGAPHFKTSDAQGYHRESVYCPGCSLFFNPSSTNPEQPTFMEKFKLRISGRGFEQLDIGSQRKLLGLLRDLDFQCTRIDLLLDDLKPRETMNKIMQLQLKHQYTGLRRFAVTYGGTHNGDHQEPDYLQAIFGRRGSKGCGKFPQPSHRGWLCAGYIR